MGLETGDYIDDLNATWPLGTDGKNQGDDHLRLTKKTVKQSFPGITGPVTATQTELNALDADQAATTPTVAADDAFVMDDADVGTVKVDIDNVDTYLAQTTKTLTNKTLTAPVIATISNSGTLTLPTGAETLVGRATTDTLTNKTIDGASNTITIGQGEIKSTTSEHSQSLGTNSGASYVATGGTYYISDEARANGSGFYFAHSGAGSDLTTQPSNSSYETRYTLFNKAASTQTIFLNERYIQASPPYDLGDGDIPLFIEVIIDNATGNIIAITASPDPVWANNGPTDIRPDRADAASGRKFKKVFDFPPGLEPLPDTAPLQSRIARQRALAEFMKTPAYKEIEVTKTYKNSDMNRIPHHAIGHDLSGKTIVLLDPVSPVTEELMVLHECGESVNQMLHDGYFNIGNTELGRAKPDAVMTVSIDWK